MKNIIFIISATIISAILLFVTPTTKALDPQNVYRVYLAGKSMGLIEDADALEEYIDNEQEMLKEKYNVDKVYAPSNLTIEKDITYNEAISTPKQIYEKIKDIEPFTIKGYAINIGGVDVQTESGTETTNDQNIYVLDKEVFNEAMDNTIRSLIDSDVYDNYLNNTQPEIETTGTIVEDVYIENKIVIQETNIPSDEYIYESVDELSKYLLFGTLDEQRQYTVQDGDTISDVAFNNMLSTQEFLIANPTLSDANSLLFTGQQVTISIIDPQIRLVEVDHTVFDQEIPYETETRYDNTKTVGTVETIQEGQKGINRVTSKVLKVNGQTDSSVIDDSATKVLKEPVKEIVVRGTRQNNVSGGVDSGLQGDTQIEGTWRWPTMVPYTINSSYDYRWGTLHDGVDIGGSYGSPIYAANNGIVVASTYKYDNGEYIIVNHNNGYYTIYAHLAERYVSVGDTVTIGQQIGAMGQSGFATGTHLHFGLFRGFPYSRGSYSMNPLVLF